MGKEAEWLGVLSFEAVGDCGHFLRRVGLTQVFLPGVFLGFQDSIFICKFCLLDPGISAFA